MGYRTQARPSGATIESLLNQRWVVILIIVAFLAVLGGFLQLIGVVPDEAASTSTPAPAPASSSRGGTGSGQVEPFAAPAVPAGSRQVIPSVIGLPLDEAMSAIEYVGFTDIHQVDAQEGRVVLWDSNWTVVDQTPVGGTLMATTDPVTLYVVK